MRIVKDIISNSSFDINELWISVDMNEKWSPVKEAFESKMKVQKSIAVDEALDAELKSLLKTPNPAKRKLERNNQRSPLVRRITRKKGKMTLLNRNVSAKIEKKLGKNEEKKQKSKISSQSERSLPPTSAFHAEMNGKLLNVTEKVPKVETTNPKVIVPIVSIPKAEAMPKEADDLYNLFEFRTNEISGQPKAKLTPAQKDQILEHIKAKNLPFPISSAFYSTLKGMTSIAPIQGFPAMEEWRISLKVKNYQCECYKYELWRPEPFTFKINEFGSRNQAKLSAVVKFLKSIDIQKPVLSSRLWSLCKYSSKNPQAFSAIDIDFYKPDKNMTNSAKTVEIKSGAVIFSLGASEERIRKALIEMLRVEDLEVLAPTTLTPRPRSPPVSNNKQIKGPLPTPVTFPVQKEFHVGAVASTSSQSSSISKPTLPTGTN